MANPVFSCPKCGQMLSDIPATGLLVAVCAHCRLKYEVVRGRVSAAESRQITVRTPSYQQPGVYSQRHEMRIDLPSRRAELVSFDLTDEDESLLARPGDILSVIHLMRGTKREQLLSVHNATTGRSLTISLPGERGTIVAWTVAGVAAVAIFVVVGGLAKSPTAAAVAALVTFIGVGVKLGYRFMPRTNVSPEEEARLSATQRLLAEKLNIETATARTVRELQARREVRDRLASLRAKMVSVGLAVYQARIDAIDRALELIDAQLGLEMRLRDGYERGIQMLEIELEAGAAADALDAAAAPHIAATLAEMRDLEGQQAELARQISANVEVEALLRTPGAAR